MQTEGRTPLLKSRLVQLGAVAAVVFLVDLVSKAWAGRALVSRDVTLIPGVLKLSLASNTGGAFGLFRSGRFFFVGAGIALMIFVVILARRIKTLAGAIAGGLIVGGALANLAQRIFVTGGRVTDFIELKYWPTFNLADAALFVGTILAAIVIWRGGNDPAPLDSDEDAGGNGV